MKKSGLIFYWVILALLMFLYYNIGDVFYSTIPINTQGTLSLLIVVVFIAPLTFFLGFVRLWLLKRVNQRQRFFDIAYFIIPALIILACFAAQIWAGIFLSMFAGVLITYEFIRSVIKKDILLLKKSNHQG